MQTQTMTGPSSNQLPARWHSSVVTSSCLLAMINQQGKCDSDTSWAGRITANKKQSSPWQHWTLWRLPVVGPIGFLVMKARNASLHNLCVPTESREGSVRWRAHGPVLNWSHPETELCRTSSVTLSQHTFTPQRSEDHCTCYTFRIFPQPAVATRMSSSPALFPGLTYKV